MKARLLLWAESGSVGRVLSSAARPPVRTCALRRDHSPIKRSVVARRLASKAEGEDERYWRSDPHTIRALALEFVPLRKPATLGWIVSGR